MQIRTPQCALLIVLAAGAGCSVNAMEPGDGVRRTEFCGTFGGGQSDRPYVRGTFMTMHWAHLEPEPGVFNWEMLHTWVGSRDRAVMLMVWVGPHSPRWLCWNRQPRWCREHPGLKYPLAKLEAHTYNGDPAYRQDAGQVFTPIEVVARQGADGQAVPYHEANKFWTPWYTQGLVPDTQPGYDSARPSQYEYFCHRLHRSLAYHIQHQMPAELRRRIVLLHTAEGPTGDPCAYKDAPADPRHAISPRMWTDFKLRAYRNYVAVYGPLAPDLQLLFSVASRCEDYDFLALEQFLLEHVPNHWRKLGQAAKGYNLNGELDVWEEVKKYSWPGSSLETIQPGDSPERQRQKTAINEALCRMRDRGQYVQFRSGTDAPTVEDAAFRDTPVWNSYWLCLNRLALRLDVNNMPEWLFAIPENEEGFRFYNKYAGVREPTVAAGAFCALRRGLDVADLEAFPEAQFGPYARERRSGRGNHTVAEALAINCRRGAAILRHVGNGARVGEMRVALGSYRNTRRAEELNDIGKSVLRGNYERFLTQLEPEGTSVGHWRVWAGEDPVRNTRYQQARPDQPYGRFARGFQHATNKDRMYFDLDDRFHYARMCRVLVTVIYYDAGEGQWALQYDARDDPNKTALTVRKTDSGVWKRVEVPLDDAWFGNRGPRGSDLVLDSVDCRDDIFHLIEVTRR